MDFFKILSFNNDRRIRETTVSSILNYLLNPKEDHGFREEFLSRVIKSLYIREGEFWPDDPRVEIYPEFRCENNRCAYQGDLDSLITLSEQTNSEHWYIGVEIKISDSSANNRSKKGEAQLIRYGRFLKKHPHRMRREEKVNKYLVYIVPEYGNIWRLNVKEYMERINKEELPQLIALPWRWSNDSPGIEELANIRIARSSVEAILKNLIHAYQDGEISPPDNQALSLVRSLRNAILMEFDFTGDEMTPGRFPTHEEYLRGLAPDQQRIFECLREAAAHNRLYARKDHTSIGIPRDSKPKSPDSNSLCRIRTVQSYSDPVNPLNSVIIEIPYEEYQPFFQNISQAIEMFRALDATFDYRQKHCHQDSMLNKRVALISFSPKGFFDRTDAIEDFRELFRVLRNPMQITK